MKTQESLLEKAHIPPGDMTWDFSLFCLYALQQWECLPRTRDGGLYGAGYFYNTIFSVLQGLHQVSRDTTLKHLASPVCVICHTPIDLARTMGDHIIPRAKSGPDDVGNLLFLCKSHNASKGQKDLLVWWVEHADFPPLPRQLLCLYARICWQYRHAMGWAGTAAPPAHHHFLAQRTQGLSAQHCVALYGAAYAGLGFVAWEQQA